MKNLIRRIGLMFLVMLALRIAPAQSIGLSSKNTFLAEPKIRFGPLLDIYPNLPDHGLAVSTEVNLAWQTNGKKYWNQSLGFPQIGIIVGATSFGNPQELGGEISLVPGLTYHFTDIGRMKFTGTLGFGFAVFNKPYNRISNPDNKLIGSRITNKTLVSIDLDYPLSETIRLTAGISYLHYSNGHYQLPNVGINVPAVQFGLKYYPSGYPDHFYKRDTLSSYSKRWLGNIRVGLGAHEFGDPVKPVMGPKYPIYTLSIYASRRMGLVTNLQAGIHLNYYTSFHDYITFHEFYDAHIGLNSFTALAFGGVELLLGHFSFSGQMGVYLFNPFYRDLNESRESEVTFDEKAKEYLSFKLGAQYYLFSTRETTRFNPWIGIFLKTNAGQADFAEFSIGIAI